MTIGRRFLNMARSELNSLLDFAAKRAGDDDNGQDQGNESLHGYSAKELEEELERRRSAHQEVEDAIHGRRPSNPPQRPGTRSDSDSDRKGTAAAGTESLRVQKAYAALEVPQGSSFEVVRKAYRTLMRKYHPDHHTESPEKQRAANDVAQRLSAAYQILEDRLRK